MSLQLQNFCARTMNKYSLIKLCRNNSTINYSTNMKLFNYSVQKYAKLQQSMPSSIIKCRGYTNRYVRNHPSSSSSSSSDFEHISPNNSHTKKMVMIPEYWPNVPLIATNNIIFPHFAKTIEITNPMLINLIRKKIASNEPYVGIFLRRDPENKSQIPEHIDDIHQIGTFCHISIIDDQTTKLKLAVSAVRRIRITNQFLSNDYEYLPPWLRHFTETNQNTPQLPADEPLLMVEIDNVSHQDFEQSPKIRAMTQEIIKTIHNIIGKHPISSNILKTLLQQNINNIVYLCDFGAALTTAQPDKLQSVIAESNIEERLLLTLSLLTEERETIRLQEKITTEIEEKIRKVHKKFMLTEQIAILKKELGLSDIDDKDVIVQKFRNQLQGKCVPKPVLDVIDDELKKIKLIDGYGADFNVVRNYVEWLTAMPWGVRTQENQNLDTAARLLDAQHFGMHDVKMRILEFIAVNTLKGSSSQGKILCFHGPPGVGKTSIARSIADALNRQYYRFSVGGLANVAEIKGHRRTYVGAMPGKIIQCLRKTKTENPLVLIDEIDKIGRSIEQGSGDPSSALLELLDPEQNVNFMDYYLDVPVDLSNILFICTANVIDTIPGPLLDRMELIEMSGYVEQEKHAIAKQYLITRAMQESGVTDKHIEIDESALAALMKSYCRESGVRDLQKLIEKIIRKVALKVVQNGSDQSILISDQNLSDFVGKPVFTTDRLYDNTPAGVVMGLGYTKLGGTVLFIETGFNNEMNLKPFTASNDNLQLTGNLGNVMRESAVIALSVAKNYLKSLNTDESILNQSRIHVHVPLGAQPKDGPSAGVTIVAALMSLAMNRPVRQNVAMTGEITLSGKILPVGGVKEKTIAAKRSGVTCLILPEENKSDYSELEEYITDGIEVHFVSNYGQVYDIIFERNDDDTLNVGKLDSDIVDDVKKLEIGENFDEKLENDNSPVPSSDRLDL